MLYPKADFVGLTGVVHLAAGGETPMLISHQDAVQQFFQDKALGMPGRERFFAMRHECAQRVAKMLNVHASDIAFVGSSSAGIISIVSAFDWQPGDEVITGTMNIRVVGMCSAGCNGLASSQLCLHMQQTPLKRPPQLLLLLLLVPVLFTSVMSVPELAGASRSNRLWQRHMHMAPVSSLMPHIRWGLSPLMLPTSTSSSAVAINGC